MILDRYLRPETPEECVQALADWGEGAYLLAGGTDLIPKIRQGKMTASTVIDLLNVPELNRVAQEEDGVFIGATTRLGALQKNGSLAGPMDVLRQCAGHVSSMQVRNVATIGGNVCNASPAADTVPGLFVLDGIARIYGKQGKREMPLVSFFTGPGKTDLGPQEMLTGVFLPYCLPQTGAAYRKFAIRGDSDLSIVGAGARITMDEEGLICGARIALAAAGPTPLRMIRAEQMLDGMPPDDALFKEAAAICAENCLPITDHRATKEYRKQMVRLWVEDALKGALNATQA